MLGDCQGSWLGNRKEGNGAKSLTSCRWRPLLGGTTGFCPALILSGLRLS